MPAIVKRNAEWLSALLILVLTIVIILAQTVPAGVRIDGRAELQVEIDSIQTDTTAIIVDVAAVQIDTTELLDEMTTVTADTTTIIADIATAQISLLEIETHLHSGERWFGAAATPTTQTHIADRIGAGAAGAEAVPLSIDAGNDDWGTWTQILGNLDTPAESGKCSYDFHRLLVTDTERNSSIYMLQISFSSAAPGDDPSADSYTELVFFSKGASLNAPVIPIVVQSPLYAATTRVWARCRVPNADTGTMAFYIGLHEYDD